MTIQAETSGPWAEQVRLAARDKSQECHDLAKKLDRTDPLRPALISARNAFWDIESTLAYGLSQRQEAADGAAA
jgi:hypothetical protein